MKRLESHWNPLTATLRTELRGAVSVDDVDVWQAALRRAVADLPPGTRFRLLFDLRGYEPGTLDAHRAMRGVVPEILASHGMRPAVVDLFDDAAEPAVVQTRGVVCTAFANVHHDVEKMRDYEQRIGGRSQRFFADIDEAERWLASAGD